MEEARATPAAGDHRPRILERESELERIEALIQLARFGHGRLAYDRAPSRRTSRGRRSRDGGD
jgi:hypothetical protein